jgi:dipeptidase E
MGKIVAIGGGEIGFSGSPVETTKIDREIIKLTGKKHPKLLFVPTASRDSIGYSEAVKKHFGKRLGCDVDVLYLIREQLSQRDISRKIFSSDIIYVGGGNTLNMMRIWRRQGVDKLFLRAYNRGIVLSGISAGAICWFRYGVSDSQKKKSSDDYARVSGLGLVNATISPHHIREPDREKGIINIITRTPGVGIALDDYSAIEIVNGRYRIITSKAWHGDHKVQAHIVCKVKDKLYYEPIFKKKEFAPLEDLLGK